MYNGEHLQLKNVEHRYGGSLFYLMTVVIMFVSTEEYNFQIDAALANSNSAVFQLSSVLVLLKNVVALPLLLHLTLTSLAYIRNILCSKNSANIQTFPIIRN